MHNNTILQRYDVIEIEQNIQEINKKEQKGTIKKEEIISLLDKILTNLLVTGLGDLKREHIRIIKSYITSKDYDIQQKTSLIFENLYNCNKTDETIFEDYFLQLDRNLNSSNGDLRAKSIHKILSFKNLKICDKAKRLLYIEKGLSDLNNGVIRNTLFSLIETIKPLSFEKGLNSNAAIAAGTVEFEEIKRLLSSLSRCSSNTDKVYIMDYVNNRYTPKEFKETTFIVEFFKKMASSNSITISMKATQAVVKLSFYLDKNPLEVIKETVAKAMLERLKAKKTSGSETEYIILRNVLLIVTKYPNLLQLANEIKMFFCSYEDPSYIKVTKLEILYTICNEQNSGPILHEILEYSTEADVQFVKACIKTIGLLAIKIPKLKKACVSSISELFESKTSYVVQEGVVAFGSALAYLVANCYQQINRSIEILGMLAESFYEENEQFQLAALTCVVKCFIQQPTDQCHKLVLQILKHSTQTISNPDVRTRAYFYQRLLAKYPRKIHSIVENKHSSYSLSLDYETLNTLLLELGCVSSVYHQPQYMFLSKHYISSKNLVINSIFNKELLKHVYLSVGSTNTKTTQLLANLIDINNSTNQTNSVAGSITSELMSLSFDVQPSVVESKNQNIFNDVVDYKNLSVSSYGNTKQPMAMISNPNKTPYLESKLIPTENISDDCNPLSEYSVCALSKDNSTKIICSLSREHDIPSIELIVQSCFELHIEGIKIEPNLFGLSLQNSPPDISVEDNGILRFLDKLVVSNNNLNPDNSHLTVGVTFKTHELYIKCVLLPHIMFSGSGNVSQANFLQLWNMENKHELNFEHKINLKDRPYLLEQIEKQFSLNNIFIVAKKLVDDQAFIFFSLSLDSDLFISQMTLEKNTTINELMVEICIKNNNPSYHAVEVLNLVKQALLFIIDGSI